MDLNKLIARVKGILLTPKTEWPVIAGEPTTVADLYKGYILWLAAIPAVFAFLKMSLIGASVPFAARASASAPAVAACRDLRAVARDGLRHGADHRCAGADVRRHEGSGAGAEDGRVCVHRAGSPASR